VVPWGPCVALWRSSSLRRRSSTPRWTSRHGTRKRRTFRPVSACSHTRAAGGRLASPPQPARGRSASFDSPGFDRDDWATAEAAFQLHLDPEHLAAVRSARKTSRPWSRWSLQACDRKTSMPAIGRLWILRLVE
jgi:hypothetical protein